MRAILSGVGAAAGTILSTAALQGATDVLTWHNDKARTGQNLTETQLTPANVNSTNFGKLFQINVNGKVDAQPLFVSGLVVPNKGSHNAVFVVTEHDTVYCCDADDGTVLWSKSMLKQGETPSDDRGCGQVTPEIGITSTPVIDRSSGPHGTIYLVAMSKNGGNYFQRLHALDLTTGAEQFAGPVDIAANYPGTADPHLNGNVIFSPGQYEERCGLVLSNGVIYTHWTSHCDINPYTAWVIAYDQYTLARKYVLNLQPNGYQGAMWQAGAAPAVDSSGAIYALTGNGIFDTTIDSNGFPSKRDFGNSIVKLQVANNSLQCTDYWTMFNSNAESNVDQDLGSGGAMVLPDLLDSNGATRHLVVGAGKDAHIYLADRDNMGKFNPNNNSNLYQDVTGVLLGGVFAAPAYFNNRIYYGGAGDKLRLIPITNARVASASQSETASGFGYPGTIPSISANGSANGIVWAHHNLSDATLRAYDANDLSRELYNSSQAANNRDLFGAGNKFIVPTISTGKVYVGTKNSVGVFGLFNPPKLANISTRADVGTGDNVLIGGFIVLGSSPKTVVLRAIGPSLQSANLSNFLADPVLELHNSTGAVIASNNDWQTNNPNAAQIQQVHLDPSDPKESALLATLSPGAYSAVVSGNGNTTGIGLVELFDLSHPPTSNLANLSARGFVETGDNVLIGGIIVTGVAAEKVVFRAIGPDLANSQVANPLSDPLLDLRDANGTQIAFNNNWRDTQESEIIALGLAPKDDRDSAIVKTLQPGGYSAIVSGAGGATGVALVEGFEVR